MKSFKETFEKSRKLTKLKESQEPRLTYDGTSGCPDGAVVLKCCFVDSNRPHIGESPTGDPRIHTVAVKGANAFYAFAELAYCKVLPLTLEDIFRDRPTVDDIVWAIQSHNGDGCAYIVHLENVTKGEVYIHDEIWMED